MKTIIKIFKVGIIAIEVLLIVVCVSELYEFLKDANSYHIGSEGMLENGGWSYSSNFTFIFLNSIMIIFSTLQACLVLVCQKIKFLLLAALLAICQIGCLFYL